MVFVDVKHHVYLLSASSPSLSLHPHFRLSEAKVFRGVEIMWFWQNAEGIHFPLLPTVVLAGKSYDSIREILLSVFLSVCLSVCLWFPSPFYHMDTSSLRLALTSVPNCDPGDTFGFVRMIVSKL